MARRVRKANKKPKTVYFRRKREGRTNYKKRRHLLLNGAARLVIRRTNKHTIAQLVTFDVKGDKTVAYAHSKELEKHGFKQSGKSLPGAYLTGVMLAKRAKVKDAVVDVGLARPLKGSRLFACVKGAIDGGLNIKASEEVFPSEDRLTGKHIKDDVPSQVEAVKGKL